MSSDPDCLHILRHTTSFKNQLHIPVFHIHRLRIHPVNICNIFTSGKSCRCFIARCIKYFFYRTQAYSMSIFNYQNLFTEAVDFIPAVGHHDHRTFIITQHFHQLGQHPLPKIRIQCRKWFIQKDHIRFICHNPCQCRSLLLSAGKL